MAIKKDTLDDLLAGRDPKAVSPATSPDACRVALVVNEPT
jgi:hypothetical protein